VFHLIYVALADSISGRMVEIGTFAKVKIKQ
jgi:hypothetical protein